MFLSTTPGSEWTLETLKRAPEPFFTTKGAGKGSGLGLSMVQGLTLQSGGAMRIESRKGEGCTISLWLPVAERAPEAVRGNNPVSRRWRRLAWCLLVDDDPRVLTTTADLLRELGHEPIEIASASEALRYLAGNQPPDVAILDFAMPEMNGLELARKIRESHPSIPVLLATGYADVAAGAAVSPS